MKEVEARLKISAVDKTGQVLKAVSGKMGEINRRAEALNRQQSGMTHGAKAAYGAMLRYAAPAALAYGAKRALVDFAAIEREMTRIGITSGATADQTNAAFSSMQTMAKQFSLPVDQAITALDTLVASGMDLKEAMAFLPSVLATAQASGAATDDIANTAIKAASALKLETNQLQNAFDIMVAGGKAGQFELKDMATYIPDLANSFASLGYSGEEGLKRLVAILQTIREDTGSASSAATFAQNIFGKIYSADTASKFAKMGIDIRKEMDAARKSGEDTVSAFTRLSKEAINGDLSKLPLLFTDEQFRLGMQSLITSPESLKKFLDIMNSAEIKGTVFRDLARVTGDTQASIDRLSSSWDKFMNSLGKGVSRPAVPIMDAVSSDLDYGEAIRTSLAKQGMSATQVESWMAWNLPFGPFSHSSEADKLAVQGGYQDPEFLKKYWSDRYEDGSIRPSTGGPHSMSPPGPAEFPGGDHNYLNGKIPLSAVPIPEPRPAPQSSTSMISRLEQLHESAYSPNRVSAPIPASFNAFEGIEQRFAQGGEAAGNAIEQSGSTAGDAMASKLKAAGDQVGAAIAGRVLDAVISGLAKFKTASQSGANANTGRSMPPGSNGPAGGGGGGGF
ncbi:phage tail tape measure protein [Rhizobium sp. NPDC090275]|uniref:phage tail tape measure protein n=1 Tax=Rhizobium sp. NPDC090275 TaxID=3364498 RepID=UPI003839DF7E